MKNKNPKAVYYLLSFFIPVLISALAFFHQMIYPGGTNSALIYDMKEQLIALYGYLSLGGPGFDGFLYNMSGGLGGGFLGTLALYISPFDLVYIFVPARYLTDAVLIMTIAKIGLSGLFCCIFIRNIADGITGAMTVVMSSCYALMSYVFMYSMSPMWFDLIMFMPLLALSTEKIVKERKSPFFVFLAAFCFIDNYYISFMVVIALVIYYIFRLIEEQLSVKEAVRSFLSFAVHGLLATGMASVLIIPVILDFGRGKLNQDSMVETSGLIRNSLTDILGNLTPTSYSSLDYTAPPNIFCGSLVLILAIVWFVLGKKNIRSRISGGVILALYLISFVFAPVDRIWHGFRDPVGYSHRYAFTFVFFMICFAVRGYRVLKEKNFNISNSLVTFIKGLCIVYTFAELYINGSYILSKLAVEVVYTNREQYVRYSDSMAEALKIARDDSRGEYSRIYKNFRFSSFDGALYGYDGIERFSSSYNDATTHFLIALGIGASNHIIDDRGVTPPSGALFDLGYFISSHPIESVQLEYIGEYKGFIVYRTKYVLPLIFGTEISNPGNYEEFTDDPFENTNLVFSDLSGRDAVVFTPQSYEPYERRPDEYLHDDAYGVADCFITPEASGDHWMYSKYKMANLSRFAQGLAVSAYASYYLDGEQLGTYRDTAYVFCNDIGFLEEETTYDLTLESSLALVGDVLVYRFNEEEFSKIYDDLSAKGFKLTQIGRNGISARGTLDKDSYVLISLPYEDGYSVYVDGVKTAYTSYRDALTLVRVGAGEHEITVKYIPPGLIPGAVISILSVILAVIYLNQDHFGKKLRNIP